MFYDPKIFTIFESQEAEKHIFAFYYAEQETAERLVRAVDLGRGAEPAHAARDALGRLLTALHRTEKQPHAREIPERRTERLRSRVALRGEKRQLRPRRINDFLARRMPQHRRHRMTGSGLVSQGCQKSFATHREN